MRAYTYIDDLLDGIILLMKSDLQNGVNIGRRQYVSVIDLVQTIAEVAGKKINIKHIEGPEGVNARNFRNDLIKSIGWKSNNSLYTGIAKTYPWVKTQVEANK